MSGKFKIEEVHRGDARQNDRSRRCESFENVIGIFDDDGHNETAEGLQEDDQPDNDVIAKEETIGRNLKTSKYDVLGGNMVNTVQGLDYFKWTMQRITNVVHGNNFNIFNTLS